MLEHRAVEDIADKYLSRDQHGCERSAKRHALFRKRKMLALQQVPCANARNKKRGGQVCRAKHMWQADKPGGIVYYVPPIDDNQPATMDCYTVRRLHPAVG